MVLAQDLPTCRACLRALGYVGLPSVAPLARMAAGCTFSQLDPFCPGALLPEQAWPWCVARGQRLLPHVEHTMRRWSSSVLGRQVSHQQAAFFSRAMRMISSRSTSFSLRALLGNALIDLAPTLPAYVESVEPCCSCCRLVLVAHHAVDLRQIGEGEPRWAAFGGALHGLMPWAASTIRANSRGMTA